MGRPARIEQVADALARALGLNQIAPPDDRGGIVWDRPDRAFVMLCRPSIERVMLGHGNSWEILVLDGPPLAVHVSHAPAPAWLRETLARVIGEWADGSAPETVAALRRWYVRHGDEPLEE